MTRKKGRRSFLLPEKQTLPPKELVPRGGGTASSTLCFRPVWKLSVLDLEGPFGWKKLSAHAVTALLDRLKAFEEMTWSEILLNGKKQNHSIPVNELCKNAQKRLRELEQDDIDDLVSLRCGSTERVFGIRVGAEFRILWWDPAHSVCESHLKNT